MHKVFCPICSSKLTHKNISGRNRAFCSRCEYTYWGSNTLGVGGVLIDNEKALLVQRAHDPGCGRWCIPGGYVEVDESLESAVKREILEETGLSTEAICLLGVRDYPAAFLDLDTDMCHDVYFVFLMRLLGGTLEADINEVRQAAFLSLEECLMRDTAPLSLYFIKTVLQSPVSERGFIRQGHVRLAGLKSELYSINNDKL